MFRKKDKFTGIDFREAYISQATIKMEQAIPVLMDVNTVKTPGNIIENARITDKKSIAGILKKDTKTKLVHLAFPTQNIIVRRITSLPNLKKAELSKLLQYQVGDSIHLPFDNPIYDFVKIGTIEANQETELNDQFTLNDNDAADKIEASDSKSDLLFFATSEPLSQDFLETCNTAGLKPVTAEIRGLALQRLINYTNQSWLNGTEMVVDLSDESMDIHIFSNGVIAFSRMMSTVAKESGKADVLLHNDVLTFEEDTVFSNKEAAVTLEPLDESEEQYIDTVVKEIEKAQNFFHYSLSKGSSDFRRVIVTGKNTSKAIAQLKARLDMEVSEIDFSALLHENFKKIDELNSSSVAIGLAMKGNVTAKKKWK
ncbi:type IV pilus assembly protein PilM [Bacillus mesophilus]|uniref:Pilus assembly protein PilM n=1 Tax=Bacillus mesophilus TaxID=1808955 RepID=A0A6M0Q9M4_9BACI|nr:pilus assembly protein PilM [Bacillus mesophilus]MBM7662318.1 type IV pilus assembly protein PilM [Bacillus mesophilus]NEY73052.1 pilus assembly protein PilM [Bacillus mesophilus]